MSRLAVVVAVLFVALPVASSTAQQKPGDGWFTYMPAGGGFAVLMPLGIMESTETLTDPKFGPYTTHITTSRNGAVLYLSGWTQYSMAMDIQSELDADRDNFVKGVKATLTGETKITMAGAPGREFTSENADGFFISRMCMASPDRVHMLVVGVPKGSDDTRNISRFFASFGLRK